MRRDHAAVSNPARGLDCPPLQRAAARRPCAPLAPAEQRDGQGKRGSGTAEVAALRRTEHQPHTAAAHLRTVAWIACQVHAAGAPAFRSAVDLFAFAWRRARTTWHLDERAGLARAALAMWEALQLLHAAPMPPAPASAERAA